MAKKKKQKKLLKQMRRDYQLEQDVYRNGFEELNSLDLRESFPFPSVNPSFQELDEDLELENAARFLKELKKRSTNPELQASLGESLALVEALALPSGSEKIQTLEKLSQQYPENFEIQMAYIEATIDDFTYDRISLYKSFTDLILDRLDESPLPSWTNSNSEGYLHGLALLLETYFDFSLWTLAAEILSILDEFLLERDCPEHLPYLAAAVYCMIYQPEHVFDLYEEKLAAGIFDPGLNLYAVIVSLEEWDLETATTLFKELMERDSEFASPLASENWLQDTIEEAMTDFEAPFTFALFPLLRFLADKEIITKELTKMYCSFGGKQSFEPKSEDDLFQVLLNSDPGFARMAQMFRSPALEGLQLDRKGLLAAEGLLNFEDFTSWTEKQVLAIRGIGPATLQQLKDNGVVFKKG